MKKVIFRRNKMFVIDRTQLKSDINVNDVCNALYAAVYTEFLGATDNPIYKDLTNSERFSALNEFAYNWLQSRGYIE